MRTDRVGACDLEAVREVVEGVRPGAERVLGAGHLGEEPGGAVDAQLADVHVLLARAHGTTLTTHNLNY